MPPKPFCEPRYVPPRPRGRPRKALKPLGNGHMTGTANAGSRVNSGPSVGALASVAVVPVPPRLLDLPNAALYLTVSTWTLREMASLGVVKRVRVPLPNTAKRRGGEMRKLLFDRADLDRLVESWKERAP